MTDSKAFGKLLNNLRSGRGITLEEFAKMIDISKNRLAEWEAGSKTPNHEYAQRIVKALNLDGEKARSLLSLAGHAEVTPVSNVYRPTGIVIENQITESSRKANEEIIQRLNEQLAQARETVEKISAKLDRGPSSPIKEGGEIISEIRKLTDSLSDVHFSSPPITAPVILPPPEDMEVRLVSSTSLQRLEEYRSEENKWYAVMGIFLGAVLGIFVNIATGGSMTPVAWILVVTFAAFSIVTGLTAREYQRRGNNIRARILPDQSETAARSNN